MSPTYLRTDKANYVPIEEGSIISLKKPYFIKLHWVQGFMFQAQIHQSQ